MNVFSLPETAAKIMKLTPKREKHGKTKRFLGYEINVAVEVDIDALKNLAIGDDIDYREFFFDEKGVVRASGISSLKIDREYEEHLVRINYDNAITDQGIYFRPTKIKKFSAVPVFGFLVKLSFQIQHQPDDEELVFLNHALVKDVVRLSIEQPSQQDIFEHDLAEAAAE